MSARRGDEFLSNGDGWGAIFSHRDLRQGHMSGPLRQGVYIVKSRDITEAIII